MTNKEAIDVLEMVEAHGIADRARRTAILALKNADCEEDVGCDCENCKLYINSKKTAYWIDYTNDDLRASDYQCSNCNNWTDYNTKYCPNCGRRMLGADENEE